MLLLQHLSQKAKKIKTTLTIIVSLCVLSSVLYYHSTHSREYYPRPTGYLHTDLPTHSYTSYHREDWAVEISSHCTASTPQEELLCLYYPSMKAHINIRHSIETDSTFSIEQDIKENISRLSTNAYSISAQDYHDEHRGIKASIYTIKGDVAIPLAFHLTDINDDDYMYGVAYFDLRPSYDSLLPSIEYLHYDIKRLIESYYSL